MDKYENTTDTLPTNFRKRVGGANQYVWFEYAPHKNSKHTWGQVLVSMNTGPINANKKVYNQRNKSEN